MNAKQALILVDLQNDFLPGGALGVAGGDEIIPVVNQLMKSFDLVAATQDWHPSEHGSFAVNHPGHQVYDVIDLNGIEQVLWPTHCVQNTWGAELSKELDQSKITKTFPKGTLPAVDSYSGFYDNDHQHATGLGEWLRSQAVSELTVAGIATDYCVQFTVLDAIQDGFAVTLCLPACRGVNLDAADSDRAIERMRTAGAVIQRAYP